MNISFDVILFFEFLVNVYPHVSVYDFYNFNKIDQIWILKDDSDRYEEKCNCTIHLIFNSFLKKKIFFESFLINLRKSASMIVPAKRINDDYLAYDVKQISVISIIDQLAYWTEINLLLSSIISKSAYIDMNNMKDMILWNESIFFRFHKMHNNHVIH